VHCHKSKVACKKTHTSQCIRCARLGYDCVDFIPSRGPRPPVNSKDEGLELFSYPVIRLEARAGVVTTSVNRHVFNSLGIEQSELQSNNFDAFLNAMMNLFHPKDQASQMLLLSQLMSGSRTSFSAFSRIIDKRTKRQADYLHIASFTSQGGSIILNVSFVPLLSF
jgi:hypothetical protein